MSKSEYRYFIVLHIVDNKLVIGKKDLYLRTAMESFEDRKHYYEFKFGKVSNGLLSMSKSTAMRYLLYMIDHPKSVRDFIDEYRDDGYEDVDIELLLYGISPIDNDLVRNGDQWFYNPKLMMNISISSEFDSDHDNGNNGLYLNMDNKAN